MQQRRKEYSHRRKELLQRINMLIEVPVGNIESVVAAHRGGADRIELCSALSLGGLTPSPGMLESILEISITKFVMIRPREGDFNYSIEEFNCMLSDIEYFKNAGADGIVSGILRNGRHIDIERMKELIAASHPLPFTFHRAFDLTTDPYRALEELIELKADRILTSGQKSNAYEGRELISKLIQRAGDRIVIMPGAGINPDNALSICETGAKEIHLSGKRKRTANSTSEIRMGNNDDVHEVTDESIIRKIKSLIG
jgi:copper homeostasis protein